MNTQPTFTTPAGLPTTATPTPQPTEAEQLALIRAELQRQSKLLEQLSKADFSFGDLIALFFKALFALLIAGVCYAVVLGCIGFALSAALAIIGGGLGRR